MAQRQFRSDDTSIWAYGFGSGKNGVYTPSTGYDPSANTSIVTTINSTAATFGLFTNFNDGDLIMLHQSREGGGGAGNWELNRIASHVSNAVTLSYNTIYAYDTTAQVYQIREYTAVSFASDLSINPWNGIYGGICGWFCTGTTTITGTVLGNGIGYRGGVGAVNGGSYCGEGTSMASTVHVGNTSGSGGGTNQTTSATSGGGGGNGGAGGNGQGQETPHGGYIRGLADLTVMVFGGGGGGGDSNDQHGSSGNGANGAGIFFCFSKFINTTAGAVDLIGNNGNASSPEIGRDGGGGAGGSALFKGQVVNLGTSRVNAPGGNGASYAGPGGTGRVHVDYLVSCTGTTDPTADVRFDSTLADKSPLFFL